jgi:histone H3/H4
MPKKSVSVTKPFTLQTFMKTVTSLKISRDVLADFITALDDLVSKITKTSGKFAEQDNRKTILAPDLEKALQEILRTGGLTVDELLPKIEMLSIIELSRLSKEIKKMADELLKPKTSKSSGKKK